MPNLHIQSSTGNKTLDLYNAQESGVETKGEVKRYDLPTFDSDELLLSNFTRQEKVSLTGRATAFRLSNQSAFSNDPKTALAEWVQKAMTFVNGNQGTGHTLIDDVRNESLNVVVKNFGWIRRAGEAYEVQYDMTLLVGEGALSSADTTAGTASPSSSASVTYSGTTVDLGYPNEYREEKRTQFNRNPLVFPDSPEDNIIIASSGAERQISISGKKTGTQADLESFEDTIASWMGNNNQISYSSAFPGHTLDVMITNFDTTRVAGEPNTLEYNITLIEGVAI